MINPMTPERKEEIQRFLEMPDFDGYMIHAAPAKRLIVDLLSSLEEADKKAAEWEKNARIEYRIHNQVQDQLAEAQQTIALKQSSIETLRGQVADETALHAKTAAKLIIAEQSIARQREALTWYGEIGNYEVGNYTVVNGESLLDEWESFVQQDAGKRARAALGEGVKGETIFSFPNCPICNGNKTIAHPSKAGTWLCVPCDRVFEEGAKG